MRRMARQALPKSHRLRSRPVVQATGGINDSLPDVAGLSLKGLAALLFAIEAVSF
jgi:hypothetical protein